MAQVVKSIKIPKNRIVKIGLWNNQNTRYKIGVVYDKLKAKYPNKEVYIANAGFFSMSNPWFPVFGLKIDGQVLASDFSQGGAMTFRNNTIGYIPRGQYPSSECTDAVSGYPSLLEGGAKASSFSYCIDNSDRGRTLLGFNGSYVILACVPDVAGRDDFTLDESINFMKSQGCIYAINLDGGGSSQCNFNGDMIKSSRLVNNFVYIIVEPDSLNNKKQFQLWLNLTYNAGLVIDGSLGPASKKAMIKAMQKEIGVTADGSWGPKSKKAYKYIKRNGPNNTINKVKIIQGALARKGFWINVIDGNFNEALETSVKGYQKWAGLDVDGSVGSATITKLFS